ncbi:MAG TPA: hypothetical protein VFL55_25510 [Acetobacteraceae bacterium]|nr:hypothetical protein [Acetobacteraceae bacterium]
MAIDWQASWAALRELDGDAWDRESERLEELWKAEYHTAFIDHATSRRWSRDNAEVWASEIADEALNERGGDPVEAARADVLRCEREAT